VSYRRSFRHINCPGIAVASKEREEGHMTEKLDDSHKRKGRQQHAPSTGRGAASAMDALIKRRVVPPNPPGQPPPSSKKR
jgi:hypothetical protein